MSFGGGASSVDAPNLKTVSIPQAESLVLNQDQSSYAQSDADWAARFPGLASGRETVISDLGNQMNGAIPRQAMGALETAGLGDEASRIQGGNEFQTAKELGVPILSKEQRDRNYASTLLAMNPERQMGLSGQDILSIVTANTGNVNAYARAINATQQNANATNTLQNAQDFSALTSLLGAGAKVEAPAFSPYTSPYASVYSSPYGSFYSGSNADTFGFGGGAGDGMSYDSFVAGG
jgi:hypothetical protein